MYKINIKLTSICSSFDKFKHVFSVSVQSSVSSGRLKHLSSALTRILETLANRNTQKLYKSSYSVWTCTSRL